MFSHGLKNIHSYNLHLLIEVSKFLRLTCNVITGMIGPKSTILVSIFRILFGFFVTSSIPSFKLFKYVYLILYVLLDFLINLYILGVFVLYIKIFILNLVQAWIKILHFPTNVRSFQPCLLFCNDSHIVYFYIFYKSHKTLLVLL